MNIFSMIIVTNCFSGIQQYYPQIYLHECLLVWICRRIKKIQQYEKIDVLEGIGINKSNKPNKSKAFMICHYWYFKYIGYKFDPYVSNGCHHISMMT